MKAQDLRIGNIVYQSEKYGNGKLSSYQIYQLSILNSGGIVADYYKDFKPIQLTEEWLEKFGGEKDSDGIAFIYLNKEFDTRIYLHPELNHIIVTKGQYYNIDTLEHINTVHQLQNYFYIKTNQELTQTIK